MRHPLQNPVVRGDDGEISHLFSIYSVPDEPGSAGSSQNTEKSQKGGLCADFPYPLVQGVFYKDDEPCAARANFRRAQRAKRRAVNTQSGV